MRKLRGFCTVVALGALVVGAGATATAAPTPSRNLSSYVLLGINDLNMKEFTFENLGNIGVNASGGTMSWGKNSFFANGSEVVSDDGCSIR